MENTPEVLRYAAFSTTPNGGNPAGLVLNLRAALAARSGPKLPDMPIANRAHSCRFRPYN